MSQFQTSLLNNKYEIIRQLGKGNMGSVYLVRRKTDGKELVVKKLIFSSGTGLNKEDTKELFEREINFLSRFNHRGLPQIHGTFREDEEDYLLLEYIKGETLEDILNRKNGPLPVEKAIKWTIEIAEILDYLHNFFEAPIIYKDLKPSNIIITPGGKPRLIDFGASRYYDPEKISDTHRLGTPGYAAPEQYKGRTSTQSDVFSLGVILYQMLTDYDPTVTPLKFPDMALLNPLIPEKLESIIKNAIEKDHLKRCISAMELKESLEKYMGIKKPALLPEYLSYNSSLCIWESFVNFFRDLKKKPLTCPVWGAFNYLSFTIFVRQFALMLNEGFSTAASLDILYGETGNKKIRKATAIISKKVKNGSALSASLSHLPGLFSPLFISLVKAGEGGQKPGIFLNKLSNFLDVNLKLEKNILSIRNSTYFIAGMAAGLLSVITNHILPTFVSLYEGMDLCLPLSTRLVIGYTKAARNLHITVLFIICAVTGAIIFKKYIKTRAGRRWYDKFKCSLPLVGSINRKIAISRFCRTLALLLSSKVPMKEALNIAGQSCGNELIAKKIKETAEVIDRGKNIVIPLGRTDFFPPLTIELIAKGYEKNNLVPLLYEISDIYDNELELALKYLGKKLKYIIIMGVILLVGYIVFSIFRPMCPHTCCTIK